MKKSSKDKDITKKIGRRVFVLRKQKKMTRQELAYRINISHQQLFKYEMGYNRITVNRLINIATALDFNVNDFL